MRDALVESELARAAAVVIRKGSASFAMASRLLGRRERGAIMLLYAWLRYCDDAVDGQNLGFRQTLASTSALAKLGEIESETYAALAGIGSRELHSAGLAHLATCYQLPICYFEDFLQGMKSDVEGVGCESFRDLALYCYRVAGTVGVIFAHIVGVSDTRALRHAAHLGMAMQLTNIARDIADDYGVGRCYLPSRWREAARMRGVLMAPENRASLTRLVRRLVRVSQHYYRSGDQGLKHLPFRAAVAVAAARRIYAEIGREVVARGPDAWRSRVVISWTRKLWLTILGFLSVLKSSPRRIIYRWQPASLPANWRYE